MRTAQVYLGLLFGALSVLYLFLALRRFVNRDGHRGAASKAFLRVGLIFGAVSLILLLFSRSRF